MPMVAETTVSTDLSSFLDTVKTPLADLNLTNVGSVIIAALGICIPLFLGWFGYRYVKGKLSKAFLKGRI